jgi:DNA-binding NarL/FixJ family response regulator
MGLTSTRRELKCSYEVTFLILLDSSIRKQHYFRYIHARMNRTIKTYMNKQDARPTVVLADDHAAVLENVSRLLDLDYKIVAAVSNGRQAVDAVIQSEPDIVVLDIAMPVLDGLSAAREILQLQLKTKIVFLTVAPDEDYVNMAVDLGVSGFVLKSRMHTDLARTIEGALHGNAFVAPFALNGD